MHSKGYSDFGILFTLKYQTMRGNIFANQSFSFSPKIFSNRVVYRETLASEDGAEWDNLIVYKG